MKVLMLFVSFTKFSDFELQVTYKRPLIHYLVFASAAAAKPCSHAVAQTSTGTNSSENVKCGSKLSDVFTRPERCSMKRNCNLAKENMDSNGKFIHQMQKSFCEAIIQGYHAQSHFCELNVGDQARNIVEIIFQRALMNPSKPSRKIKRVLRVKNSIEIHERFERYREKVKENAYKQHNRHPRSTVDGNELLQFYGTTISCCSDKSRRVSELCRDTACRVCTLIRSNFETDDTKKNGIRLSANSEEISEEDVTAFRKVTKMKRAVIVCRTIAGTVKNKVDGVDEECCSIGSEHSNLESLIVTDPRAVLPCFIIVFS